MLGAGTVINPIIKVVTVVAILAASYVFIVKPILDTTESTINRSFEAFDDAGLNDLPGRIQADVNRALEVSQGSEQLQDCIQRAIGNAGAPDTRRVNRCVERFGP
jgi:hypothetical protein